MQKFDIEKIIEKHGNTSFWEYEHKDVKVCIKEAIKEALPIILKITQENDDYLYDREFEKLEKLIIEKLEI